MTTRLQSLHRICIHRSFHIDLEPFVVTPTRCIACRLRVLLVVEHAHQGLHVALWLHIGTHHAIAHDGLPIFGQERRNDGVKRSLSRRHQIGRVQTVGLNVKAMPTVLQTDAKLGSTHPDPKPM